MFLRAGLLHYEQLLITILPPQHVCCYIDTAPLSLILLLVRGSDLPRALCCRENNVFVQTHKIKTTRNYADACKNIRFVLTNVNASTTRWRLRLYCLTDAFPTCTRWLWFFPPLLLYSVVIPCNTPVMPQMWKTKQNRDWGSRSPAPQYSIACTRWKRFPWGLGWATDVSHFVPWYPGKQKGREELRNCCHVSIRFLLTPSPGNCLHPCSVFVKLVCPELHCKSILHS